MEDKMASNTEIKIWEERIRKEKSRAELAEAKIELSENRTRVVELRLDSLKQQKEKSLPLSKIEKVIKIEENNKLNEKHEKPLLQTLFKKLKWLKRKKKLSKEAQTELDKIEEDAYLEAAKEAAKELGKKKAKEDFENQ